MESSPRARTSISGKQPRPVGERAKLDEADAHRPFGDQRQPLQLFLREGKSAQAGYRQIILGPEHPYLSGGLAMDAPSVGFGQNDAFAYQARAFLEEVAGIDEASSLPRCATFDEGVHNMELLAAVAESAGTGGSSVTIPAQK